MYNTENKYLARKNVRDICNHNPKPSEEESLEAVMLHIDGIFANRELDLMECEEIAIICGREFLEHYPSCQRIKDYLCSVARE